MEGVIQCLANSGEQDLFVRFKQESTGTAMGLGT
jgi:hypothetical protein